ncbi:MAG: dihydroorotase [Solobacterium sp.]|nr:dihydroorotase [Solobacterium sp.]
MAFLGGFMIIQAKVFKLDDYPSFTDQDTISVDIPDADPSDQYVAFPGFTDVHVHLREPGFSYKETIASGTLASAHGGYTTVCAMPNLKPVPDSPEHLQEELDIIAKDAVIRVLPYGALTVAEQGREAADIRGMAEHVFAYSDDGKGVQNDEMMRQVMLEVKETGKVLAAHCEVESLLHGGYIHDGEYAKKHGHKGICSESEWKEIERDIQLSEETGCPFHVCHISTKESVELIRQAKKQGLDVTCETAPHYLILDENDLQEEGRFRMNPPLRSSADRQALIEGLLDGTIDMIATDHAPHSAEEKSRGLAGSAFGIVGIETAFPLCYSYLVRSGVITLERLIELLTKEPVRRFNIPVIPSYSVWNLSKKTAVDPDTFLSMGKATPFAGMPVYGECVLTVIGDRIVYRKDERIHPEEK